MPTYVVGGNQPMSIPIPATPTQATNANAATPLTPPNGNGGGESESGSRKRSASAAGIEGEQDYLEFMPLGAGCEVGRSCHIIRFKGKTIMLDCGLHPAYVGVSSLPFFDEIDPASIDLLLVSHFHLDHAAALPFFLTKTSFKAPCYMTTPTKSIYKLILTDYIKVSQLSEEDGLYTEADLNASMDRIDTVNFHQATTVKGIKFTAYNAGHVLGAAMFVIEIAGVRILYTGDYSRREDRHLMSAELPSDGAIDVLVVEATYGIQRLPPVAEREQRFTELVRDIVEVRRGKCLLPVFALGRAQELLLILDEYWAQHPPLHHVPIYYASALAKKCMSVYQTFVNMMNKRIQMAAQISNPFHFKHIFSLKGRDMDTLADSGPCVVMASPGMLQNGLSRELLEMWAGEPENGCIMTGYAVEGTLAKHLLTEPEYIQSMAGGKIPLRMTVAYISFSAHADFTETSEFVDTLKPPHIILVHGDASEGVGRLRYALENRYKDGSIRIVAPRNCQSVFLQFRAHKIAKAIGSLASAPPTDGALMQGLLIRRNFVDYTMMREEELSTFTPLASSIVEQSIKVPFQQTYQCMKYFIQQMYEVEEIDEKAQKKQQREKKDDDESKEEKNESKSDSEEMKDAPSSSPPSPSPSNPSATPTLLVHSSIRVSYHRTPHPHILLRWKSNPVNDMLSDSLVAILTNVESNPGMAKVVGCQGGCRNAHATGHTHAHHHRHHQHEQQDHAAESSSNSSMSDILKPSSPSSSVNSSTHASFRWFLEQHYGSDLVHDPASGSYSFTLNTVPCTVHESSLEVECKDASLRARIRAMIRRAHAACNPINARNSTAIELIDEEEEEEEETMAEQQKQQQQQPQPTSTNGPAATVSTVSAQ